MTVVKLRVTKVSRTKPCIQSGEVGCVSLHPTFFVCAVLGAHMVFLVVSPL